MALGTRRRFPSETAVGQDVTLNNAVQKAASSGAKATLSILEPKLVHTTLQQIAERDMNPEPETPVHQMVPLPRILLPRCNPVHELAIPRFGPRVRYLLGPFSMRFPTFCRIASVTTADMLQFLPHRRRLLLNDNVECPNLLLLSLTVASGPASLLWNLPEAQVRRSNSVDVEGLEIPNPYSSRQNYAEAGKKKGPVGTGESFILLRELD